MLKKLPGLLLASLLSFTGFSQEFSYGLKGGINYPMGGAISGIQDESLYSYGFNTSKGKGLLGFHAGVFVQANFGKFFIRPEIVYTSLKTEFEFFELSYSYTVEKLDIPLLFGYTIWGPLDVYLGPAYTNIINSNLENEEFANPIAVQDTPINGQIGIKAEFGRFGFDLRYERVLSNPQSIELNFDDPTNVRIINQARFDDPRLHQLIASVVFKIGGPGLNQGNRPCY